MPQSIANKVPQHPIQVAAVEMQLDIALCHKHAPCGRGFVQGEFIKKPGQKARPAQGFWLGSVAPPQFQHLGNQPVQALCVVMDDAPEALMQGVTLLFRQQFGSVADRRQGIANLVRHVRRQPTQGRQFHLLRLCLHPFHVFEINQGMSAGLGRRQVTHTQVVLVMATQHLHHFNRLLLPMTKALRQGSRQGRQPFAFGDSGIEHFPRARILQSNTPLGVDHQNAVIHVADDALADPQLFIKLATALAGEVFIGHHPLRQQPGDDGRAKEGNADHASANKVGGVGFPREGAPAFFQQHRHRRQRGIEQSHAALANQPGSRDHHQQQYGNAALLAATGKHHHGQGQNVGGHLYRKLQAEIAWAHQQAHQEAGRGEQVDLLGGGLISAGLAGSVLASGIERFLDVPFAQPPTGALRWRAPQAPALRSSVRTARTAGVLCPQPEAGQGPQNEDCLQLNIWRPATPGPHPVMLWIHGGGNTQGSAVQVQDGALFYDGTPFASRGVVYVSINYRLGLLGYLAQRDFVGEAPDQP